MTGSKSKGVVRTHLFTKEIQKPIGGGNILDKRMGRTNEGGGGFPSNLHFPF